MGKDKGAGGVLMREKRDMNPSKPEKPQLDKQQPGVVLLNLVLE